MIIESKYPSLTLGEDNGDGIWGCLISYLLKKLTKLYIDFALSLRLRAFAVRNLNRKGAEALSFAKNQKNIWRIFFVRYLLDSPMGVREG